MSAITELALNNGETLHSQAGALLLAEMVRKSVLNTAISVALTPWHKLRAVHDPGKILLDVALAVALGGGCLADIGMLSQTRPVLGNVRPGSPRGLSGRMQRVCR